MDGSWLRHWLWAPAAVQVGTCLLVSQECPIHENYKQALLDARDSDTIVTGRSTGAPVRAEKPHEPGISADGKAGADKMELERRTLGSLRRAVLEGDTDTGSLMAGQCAGLLHQIRPFRRSWPTFGGMGGSAAALGTAMLTLADKALPVPILQGGMGSVYRWAAWQVPWRLRRHGLHLHRRCRLP